MYYFLEVQQVEKEVLEDSEGLEVLEGLAASKAYFYTQGQASIAHQFSS